MTTSSPLEEEQESAAVKECLAKLDQFCQKVGEIWTQQLVAHILRPGKATLKNFSRPTNPMAVLVFNFRCWFE